MKAICPGSFDPVTYGHLDIIERAVALFGEVIVGVGRNSAKNYLFETDERLRLIEDACAHLPGVQVLPLSGLLVDFCAEHGVGVIVKGLRFAGDFEFELQMAQLNRVIGEVETVMLPMSKDWGHLSSTMIREIASLGGDVSGFVPPLVAERIAAKVAARREG